MTAWPFGDLPLFRYGAIHIDPPWQFENWSEAGEDRNPNQHYDTMSVEEIAAMPVGHLAAPDAAVFMWINDPNLDRAPEVLRAWGFRFVTVGFYWVKLNKRKRTPFKGPGYWGRANPEQCWMGTVGNPKRLSANVDKLIMSPRREHSRKPDETHERIQQLVAGPYVELFARTRWPGWDAWGNELGKFPAAAAAAE